MLLFTGAITSILKQSAVSFEQMPSISALIHTCNNEHTLGRALETLRPCDEIIVVDHASADNTVKVAHQYGATVVAAVTGVEEGAYSVHCRHDWVLCLQPDESISEGLEAALFDWKHKDQEEEAAFSVGLREESGEAWSPLAAETRLVNRLKVNWQSALPPQFENARQLQGDLLRFKRDV